MQFRVLLHVVSRLWRLQDPRHRRVWSGDSQQIPTLRHSAGLLWSPSRARWLVTEELLLASGFPITEAVAQAAGVAVDTVSLQAATAADLGNGIHVFQAGLLLAAVLSCLKSA